MKLTRRQKRIIIISTLSFFLFLAALISIIGLVSKKNSSAPTSGKNDSPTDNSNLLQTKAETITSLKLDLSADNIREEDLLTELKNSNYLTADKTDWEDYINEATTSEELQIRKANVEAVISKLKGSPQAPGPQAPGPQAPGPQAPGPQAPGPQAPGPQAPGPQAPGPQTPPTNKWERILWEVKNFLDTNPTTLQEIKDWVKAKNYPDPLEGVDLKGASMDTLKGLPDRGPVPDLGKAVPTGTAYKYKNYVLLNAVGDGNCFLNSFSVFLTGKDNDTSLALPLRAKLCIEFMADPDKYVSGIEQLKEKLNGSHGFAINTRWLENGDIAYMKTILKRQIVLLSASPNWETNYPYLKDNNGISLAEYPSNDTPDQIIEYNKLTYKDHPFIIYNSGGHFQPLIKK